MSRRSLGCFLIILALIAFNSAPGFSQTGREIEEELRKEEEKFSEELKKKDPQMYEEMLGRGEREKRKREIRESYRQGRMSYEAAKAALGPLIKKEVDVNRFLEGIDEQIKMLEQEITRMKRIKNNPSLLIEEEIERYLR